MNQGWECRVPGRRDEDVAGLEGPLEIDGEDFRHAAEAARRSQDPIRYEEALGLYGGDLLPDDASEDWTVFSREELRELRISLLLELAQLWEECDRRGAALEALRLAIAANPLQEEAVGRLMRLLARSGQRHLALRQYHRLRSTLRHELDVEPAPEIEELWHRIRNGEGLVDDAAAGPLWMRGEFSA